MRNTRKILVALLVLMTILVSLVAVAIPASAANIPAGTKLYLVPSANWNQSNARFAAYFFGSGESWVSMTKVAGESNLYEVTVPSGSWTNVIFCRMNPSASANNWNNKWNQTSDLTYNGTSNCYTVKEGTWDKGGGTWSTYGNTCSHANVGAAATCTTAQVCLDCGDPVVSALGHTYNSSHLCTRCNGQATFTVAGSGAHLGTEWDTGNTANDMTYADGVYTKVYENVAAGSYLLKVARDHDWGTAYPDADKAYTVATAGSTVTVTLKGTTVNVTVEVPHVHSWSDATCTELSKCECGETQGELAAHNYVEGICSACGAAAPCEHEFEENTWYHPELVAADCCHTGVAVFECTKCDYYYTEESPIDPEAHGFWGDREVLTPADCATQTNGLEKVYCANGCGQSTEVEISYYEVHDWDVQKDTYATCTEAGEYYAVCTICSEVESYSSEANGHYNWYVTCGQTGMCMECGLEFTADPHTVTPCEGGMCMNCYEMFEALGHNYVEGVCSVCGASENTHVNTLVVGDTNKIVVSGAVLNDYGLPIEWVGFVADEKAHYEFVGSNGAVAYIFDSNFGLISATGASDLEAGAYWICLGNGFVGEFNVAVTKTAIPVEEKWTFWISSTDYYSVDGYNIKYNGAGNSYACVGTADIVSLAVGNNIFTITITNNGSADARVRVDIQATNQIGNHAVCNTGAVGGDVWTDFDWGGSIVTVPAGESVTLTITYDENTERGAVANLVIFVDAMRGDSNTYSADITLSDMAFSSSTPHVNTLVVGDTNKIVVSGDYVNDWNLPIEWVPFVAEESAYYSFVGSNGALAYIFTADGALVSATGAANLEAGNYLVCLGNGLVGEFNVAVTKSAWVNALALGDNKILITDALNNGVGYYIVWVPFEVTEKGNYTFGGEGVLALVYDSAYAAVTGTELEVGTYNICIAFLAPETTGVATVSVVKGTGDEPAPELPKLVAGDNTVVIDGSETNLTGQAIAWLELVVTEAGTYKVSSADLNCYICADKSFNNNLCGWTGVAELEPGTYYVAVGNAGVTGEFTVTLENDVVAPAKNTLVVGENVYVLNDPLKEIGYEWLYLTVDKDGIYTLSGLSTLTFFIWPDYPNQATVPETAAYIWNVDPITGDPLDSISVELVAGTYLVGFRYNYAEAGEYEISITYSEKIDTPDQPGQETPEQPEEPVVELTLVEKLVNAFKQLLEMVLAWINSILPGFKM